MGPASNDGQELLNRARRLVDAGLDLTIVQRNIAREGVDRATLATRQIVVVPRLDRGRVWGVTVLGIRPGDVLDLVGLASGDVVTAINGREVAQDGAPVAPLPLQDSEGTSIVEVVRGGRRVVLAIRVMPPNGSPGEGG
jgi:S1-C subfamily serine protease